MEPKPKVFRLISGQKKLTAFFKTDSAKNDLVEQMRALRSKDPYRLIY